MTARTPGPLVVVVESGRYFRVIEPAREGSYISGRYTKRGNAQRHADKLNYDSITAQNRALREALCQIGELLYDGSCAICGMSADSGRCGCPDGTIKPHENMARAALGYGGKR